MFYLMFLLWVVFLEVYRIMAAEGVLFDGSTDYVVVALLALLLAALISYAWTNGYFRAPRR